MRRLAICVLLACFPRAGILLSLVPGPVLAAILPQAGGAMLVNGMQVATSRMLDARKSLAVGLALVAAIGVEAVPGVADLVPPALPAADDRDGARDGGGDPAQRAAAHRHPQDGVGLTVPADAIEQRYRSRTSPAVPVRPGRATRCGVARDRTRPPGAWMRSSRPGWRAATSPSRSPSTNSGLDLRIGYAGPPIELAMAPPSAEELLAEDGAAARLAGYMIRRRADRAAVQHRDGLTKLSITLDH